jgi:hypothetical protein
MAEATHSYYDWQISTLMLAYDVRTPLAREDQEALSQRDQAVREELYEMLQRTLPTSYLENPQAEFPPEMIQRLTRATLHRAVQIIEGDD